MSEQWKQKAIENQNAAQELISSAEKKFADSPDNIINMLSVGASFYQYSFNNMMLIYMQRPDATYIQSFEAWKKLGVSVQRGEKGIKIFVPVQNTILLLPNGETCALSDATAEQKALYKSGVIEGKTKITYKIGNVFDISQTNFPIERRNELFLEEDPNVTYNQAMSFDNLIRKMLSDTAAPQDALRDAGTAIIFAKHFGLTMDEDLTEYFKKCYQTYLKELKELHPELSDIDIMKKTEEVLSQAVKQFREIRLSSEKTELPQENIMAQVRTEESVSVPARGIAHDNYVALMAFAPDIVKREKEHIRYHAGPSFMPLSIEWIGKNMIAMSHYYMQNGDSMADPDMEFEIDHEKQTLNARTFQNDGFGKYECVIQEDGSVNEELERELNSFAKMWLSNIKAQGYRPETTDEGVKFYTYNLTGTGEETEPVLYEDVKTAMAAYLSAKSDEKVFGVSINGTETQIAMFDMVSYKNNIAHNVRSVLSETSEKLGMTPEEIEAYIRKELSADNLYHAVEYEITSMMLSARADIIRQESEWGAWFGRVASKDTPQHYLQFEITGLSTHHQIQYILNSVHENQIVDGIAFTLETDPNDLRGSVRKANEEALKRISEFLHPAIERLNVSEECILQSVESKAYLASYVGKEQEQHYNLLREAGYEAFPSNEAPQDTSVPKERFVYTYEVVENSSMPAKGTVYGEIQNPADAIIKSKELADGTTVPGIYLVMSSENSEIKIPLSVGENIVLAAFKSYEPLRDNTDAVECIKEFVREARQNDFQTFGRFDLGMNEHQNNRRRSGR